MKTKDIYQYALGAVIVMAFFAVIYLLIIIGIPLDNKDVLLIVIGALTAKFADIVGYFYGSSKGSSDKNDIIGKNEK
jgi:hypothetical protein